MALFGCVVVLAAAVASLFRSTVRKVVDWYLGSSDVTQAARMESWFLVCGLVTGCVLAAGALGEFVHRRWAGSVGIETVAASARGEQRRISMPATVLRIAATWIASSGLGSIGREASIVETGGATGAVAARSTGGRGDAMAVAGIAAAFAAAYHAPVAAVLYLEEHLGVRRSRRAVMFAVLGAAGGFAASVVLFGGERVFPQIEESRWSALPLGLVVVLPATLAARLFLQLRVVLGDRKKVGRVGMPRWGVVVAMSVIAGIAVATFPYAAGNGLEGLRHASATTTASVAAALLVGKLIGTSAVVGAGSPCGVITPTMAMTAGASLLALLAIESAGVGVDDMWGPMILGAAAGVAVGIRAPLVALFLVPEMLGDYLTVPVVAVVVGAAVLVDRLIDIVVLKVGAMLPTGIYNEDA